MRVSVVIATLNRPQCLELLVKSLLDCSTVPDSIIIVDSSAVEDMAIQKYQPVKYVRSSRQNQPYQRYLGFLSSNDDVIVFLDDDMQLLEKDWLDDVIEQFEDQSVAGVAINFKNDNDFLQNKMPQSKFKTSGKVSYFRRVLKSLSGYPILQPGKFWLCGIRGNQPTDGSDTYYVSGGAFAARRDVLYINFNFKIIDLYLQKIGKGEDAILGFTLAQQGKIKFLSKEYFYHNDQKDSTYTVDFKSFAKRVAYSRLYLSYEYSRLTGYSRLLAFMHYNWYMLWRITGMAVNQIISNKSSRKSLIKGMLTGWLLAIKTRKELAQYTDEQVILSEALNDAKP